jgi:cell division protein FtsB
MPAHLKLFRLLLVLLIVSLAWALLLGRGGVLRNREISAEISGLQATNATQKIRNEAMNAEVQDLQTGTDALEERARTDLGMVRQGETFFRFVEAAPVAATPAVAPPAAAH